MLISNRKLQQIIKETLREAAMPPGFSISSGGGGDGGGNNTYKMFCKTILQKVSASSEDVKKISVVDPNDIDDNFNDIADDMMNYINNRDTNVIYHNFGNQPRQDSVQDLFTEYGNSGLKEFFKWLKSDFASYMPEDIQSKYDCITAFYTSKSGDDRLVTIMFLNDF